MEKMRISGKIATEVALQARKRLPIKLLGADGPQVVLPSAQPSTERDQGKRAPPRVRKPSPSSDQCVAPALELESYRERLREAFGNTLSDEFVEVMLGKLVEALRPGPFDHLEEQTLNAALATIYSMRPGSELEALLAIQIVATAFAGLRLLRQSQQHMTPEFIDVYGNYAIKLLRLQAELISVFDRYRRGIKQTVEVRHVHIHSGGQGMVGMVNTGQPEGDAQT